MQKTVIDEIFQESEMQYAEVNRLSDELGLELSQSELHEFGNLFGRLKSLVKKGYHKARPAIAAAQIARALLFPNAVDVAKHIEEQRNRNSNPSAIVERAPYKQKPR